MELFLNILALSILLFGLVAGFWLFVILVKKYNDPSLDLNIQVTLDLQRILKSSADMEKNILEILKRLEQDDKDKQN